MSNQDWWASKLTPQQPQSAPQTRPANLVPMPPSQQPMAAMPTFQPSQTAAEKAQSARQTASCPDCGSNNYMAIQNAAPRCFDCGYPIEQQGSRYGSLAGAHVEGSTKQASGNDVQNNWNPQGIIGRIN
jgi:hypothetical protein